MKITGEIAVVWFKRDLRLQDNEAVFNAITSGKKILFVYIFEESIIQDEHYSKRHWDFVKESIRDINQELLLYNTQVLTVNSEVLSFFRYLTSVSNVTNVYSHIETGILATYNRDKTFKRFCNNNVIEWKENIQTFLGS